MGSSTCGRGLSPMYAVPAERVLPDPRESAERPTLRRLDARLLERRLHRRQRAGAAQGEGRLRDCPIAGLRHGHRAQQPASREHDAALSGPDRRGVVDRRSGRGRQPARARRERLDQRPRRADRRGRRSSADPLLDRAGAGSPSPASARGSSQARGAREFTSPRPPPPSLLDERTPRPEINTRPPTTALSRASPSPIRRSPRSV